MIYFIVAQQSRLVKIGYTRDKETLDNRIKALSASSPEKLELIHTIDGNATFEKRIHEKYDDFRIHYEWFNCYHELLVDIENDVIEKMRVEFNIEQNRLDNDVKKRQKSYKLQNDIITISRDAARIIKMYNDGKTLSQIADIYGCTIQNINIILKKNNIKRRNRGRGKGSRLDIYSDEIVEKYLNGEKVDHIAKYYGCSSGPITRILKNNNVFKKFRNHKPNTDKKKPDIWNKSDEIVSEYLSGKSSTQIAKRYKTTARTIIFILEDNDVEIRKRGIVAGSKYRSKHSSLQQTFF